MLGPPFIFFILPVRIEARAAVQPGRLLQWPFPPWTLPFSKDSAFWSAKNFSATDSPKIVLLKVYLERVITAWCCVLIDKMFDNVLLEPYIDYACCRVNSSQLNEVTCMRVYICVMDREEEFVVYNLVIWILVLAA